MKQHNSLFLFADHDSFFHGRVFGEVESQAHVHLDNQTGEMTATIHLPHESYHIEVLNTFLNLSILKLI